MLQQYQGKRVVVTGDTGFKGSWLSLWLTELGAEVRGFAQPVLTSYDHYCTASLDRLWAHRDGDIRDATAVKTILSDFEPEIVFHLAAQPLVRSSYTDPKTTFDTNVAGSVNVLEAVRCTPAVRALVYVTSDKCYRNREWIWGYRENDELGGHDPYSASKAAAEIVFSSYVDSFFRQRPHFGAASVRAGNVIGGGDWATDRIIPDCIRSLSNNQDIVLRNPRAIRPWQHVLDPLYGYLLLGARLIESPVEFSGAWNFGPDNKSARTVSDLVAAVVEEWGGGSVHVADTPSMHETRLLHLNCDKAQQSLKWAPLWQFARAVKETISWYKNWHNGNAALELSREQILTYTAERSVENKSLAAREAVKA